MANHNSNTGKRNKKVVPVRAYERLVDGRIQNVCKHFRGLPSTAANQDRYDEEA
ncbi:hypothetical protein [Pseudomonas luteola]|uniref:hypothetical protein n=1 Tax=Pseudomonas luteola TaxID=47886 RepID=UPI001639EEB1|nr:hypothetical protein [Pseudomonas luteola]